MFFDVVAVVLRRTFPNRGLGIILKPERRPLTDGEVSVLGGIDLLAVLHRQLQLLPDLRLGLAQHIFDDAFTGVGVVARSVTAFPASVGSFP